MNQRYDHVTPLHRAVAMGHLMAAERLVATGAKVKRKDREGQGFRQMPSWMESSPLKNDGWKTARNALFGWYFCRGELLNFRGVQQCFTILFNDVKELRI